MATTSAPAIRYPVATDPFQPHADIQKTAEDASAAINARQTQASGTAALVGTYTGQPLRTIGGIASVVTNASGDGGFSLPPGVNGVLSAWAVSRASAAFPVTAHIYQNASTTTSTIAVRCYNGATAAASTSVGLAWGALVW